MYYTFRYRDPSTCSQAQDMRKKGSLSSAVYELTYWTSHFVQLFKKPGKVNFSLESHRSRVIVVVRSRWGKSYHWLSSRKLIWWHVWSALFAFIKASSFSYSALTLSFWSSLIRRCFVEGKIRSSWTCRFAEELGIAFHRGWKSLHHISRTIVTMIKLRFVS